MPILNADMTKKKSRAWAFIMYPESAPENWRQILKEFYLPVVISPLHDQDVGENGVLKKSHYHVMVIFGNNTTSSTVETMAQAVRASLPIAISSAWCYFKYMDHSEVDDKVLYDHSDFVFLNGLSEYDLKVLTRDEERQLTFYIFAFIKEHKVMSFFQLMEVLASIDPDACFFASKKVLLFDKYIDSYRKNGEFLERGKNLKKN